MFICKECGCEYKIKPDYCDCGNDTFDEPETDVAEKIYVNKPKPDKKEVLSRFIFGLCMLFSILVLIFFPKIDDTKPEPQKQQNIIKETHPDIPSLESFWINSKPQVIEPEEPDTSPVEQIKEIFVKPKPKPANTTKNEKPVVKNTQTNKNNKQQTTVKTQQKPQTNVQKQEKTGTIQTQTQQNNSARTNNYELIEYKNKLRHTMKNNIHFYEIQGSGECGIEFRISPSGLLLDRAITYDSDNKTVNQEVYNMLMRTYRFSAPPSSYKGEKIKMRFRLNNTSYTIDFIN